MLKRDTNDRSRYLLHFPVALNDKIYFSPTCIKYRNGGNTLVGLKTFEIIRFRL